MRTKPTLEFADADTMGRACRRAAEAVGAKVTVAIVDEAGVLLHLQRPDGAKAHSVDLATCKARTAAAVGIPTSVLEGLAKEGRLPTGEVLALAGGVPVLQAGETAGAIDVSGATGELDDRIAAAGVSALGR